MRASVAFLALCLAGAVGRDSEECFEAAGDDGDSCSMMQLKDARRAAQAQPQACCLGLTVNCLACAAGLSEEQYCDFYPTTAGCASPQPCCRALTAECLACNAGMSVDEYCKLPDNSAPDCPTPSPTPAPTVDPTATCAVCSSCGGSYPAKAGRLTYYQSPLKTEWVGYSEECAGQSRTRTGDGSVIFSPYLCCKEGAESALLEEHVSEVAAKATGAAHRELSDANKTAKSDPSWCALCDSCGSSFPVDSGAITKRWNEKEDDGTQNYESYGAQCSSFYGTKNAPPAGRMCCKQQPTCVLCGGSCGGPWAYEGGTISYAKSTDDTVDATTITFTGYPEGCSGRLQEWQANSPSFYPKLCCHSR